MDFRVAGNIDPSQFASQLKTDCILLFHPSCQDLAEKIAAESSDITLGHVSWGTFNDGFPNVFVKDALHIRNRNVAFLASFHNPSVIFEQLSVIYALPRLFIGSFTVLLPFFPTGTLERVEAEGEVATAFSLARMLSNIPLTRGGPASVVIFDIHALQERFYFGDGVLPLFESGIPLLIERLRQLDDVAAVTIAYPDEGAWKRFHYQFAGFPEVICTKVRDGDKRIVRLKEGECHARHVVIVDDLVQSGGTLIECGRLLHSLGAAHVSAYVTHAVFPHESYKRFVSEGRDADGVGLGWWRVWITDSCPLTCRNVEGVPPFEVLSLAAPIANALRV